MCTASIKDGPKPTSSDYRHAAAQLSQSRHGHLRRAQYVLFQKTAIVDGKSHRPWEAGSSNLGDIQNVKRLLRYLEQCPQLELQQNQHLLYLLAKVLVETKVASQPHEQFYFFAQPQVTGHV